MKFIIFISNRSRTTAKFVEEITAPIEPLKKITLSYKLCRGSVYAFATACKPSVILK